MGLFNRDGKRQTGSERRQYRDHLAELDVLLEDGLDRLGAKIAEMAREGSLDARLVWEQAARISSIEDEIQLVERGITERLSRDQLAELARQQATDESPGEPDSAELTH